MAGSDETGSNKLYISNYYWGDINPIAGDIPLIYGEFDNQYLEVNGDLNVRGQNFSIYNDSQAFNEMRVHSDTSYNFV